MEGTKRPSQVVVGGTGYSYARYIPPANPAATSTPQSTGTIQRFDDEPSVSSPKRKRDHVEETQAGSPAPETKKVKKSKRRDKTNDERSDTHPEATAPEPDSKEKGKREKSKSKSKKSRSDKDEVETNGAAPTSELEETGVSPSKSKREKKEKRKRRKETDEDTERMNDDDDEPVDTPMADAPPHQDENLKEEKKKRKKDKKPKEDKVEEADGAEEENSKDKRHKLVLERKTKSLKIAEEAAKRLGDEVEPTPEPEEVYELGPLPQPKPAPVVEPQLTYETLPSWLAAPIRVSHDVRTPFHELGILPKAARVLAEKGYPDAFAVQTAALPLLLPTSKQLPGDLLISAATGSGKTLAYALPIVRDISQGHVTRLRTLVVLPTRELVKQAQEVFELCAKAFEGGDRKRVRIGLAVGSQTLKSEQESLVESHRRYDPIAYKQLVEEESKLKSGDALIDIGLGHSDPRLGPWEGEVVDFSSKVDVLICTPGRLVEHIEQTPGFDLDYVRWLVVDEADKLLAQSFQGWLDVVLEKFRVSKFTAREFPDMNLDGVRKVVLSATLTRDLSLLSQLALRRPQLIVLEDGGESGTIAEHSLPAQLEEFAIRVHDTNNKPLYLLDLLNSEHMKGTVAQINGHMTADAVSDTSSDDSSDTSSSSDDDTSSSDSDSDLESQDEPKVTSKTLKTTLPTTLIFTKSNESALRLSRLLTLLDPTLTAHLSTLTSTTPTHIRRKTLKAFSSPSSPVRLIIASDLVARGIDIHQLDHVINYDLPPSAAAYVHRVGRTARAGKSGRAWTLVGDDESGWFWGKIAKGSMIRRAQKVGRVRIEEMDEGKIKTYEEALEKLGQEALVTRRR